MTKCPNCKKALIKPKKIWDWSQFAVRAYSCGNCGTDFREYFKAGKHSFTLKRAKKSGRRFVKVQFRD